MKIPPLSHTHLEDAGNCLHKYFRKHVAKDLPKEEKSPQQLHGIEVHEDFASFIGGRVDRLDRPEWDALATPMRDTGANAEVKMAVNGDLSPGSFFRDPWFRGVLDVLIAKGPVAVLFDWKTGKVREDNRELMAQSFLLQRNVPGIEHVRGAYVWLQENRVGEMHDLTNTDRWFHGTKATEQKIQEANAEEHWPKRPNGLCGWCPVKDCEHNRS